MSLPRQFNLPGKPRPIFISFGFSYDVAQIVKDFPYEKAWELHHGKPYEERDNLDYPQNLRRVVLWGKYGISYIPRKSVTLFRLRDDSQPFKSKAHGNGERVNAIDAVDRIHIYDTFGFFQERLTGAIEKMPGILSDEDLAIIKAGKEQRGQFKVEDIAEIQRYTSLELKALVRMVEKLRTSLERALEGKPIRLKDWHGAGAIAAALLDAYFGKDIRSIIGDMGEDTPQRDWAMHAYFGGRIELAKQGKYLGTIYEYDLASAYPSIAVDLPTMKNGHWEYVVNPTREQVENACIISMFQLRTHGYEWNLPFYALPYRKSSGAIMFPANVNGVYMRDHVIAAFKHFDEFERQKRLCHYGIRPQGASIELVSAWLFHPASDDKPFAWIKQLFDYRASLAKTDVRSTVIKLGINSVYGKLAQRVGQRGQPPKYASLWFAAAITAGTQRKLIEGALTDPDAIVAFATDGLYSKRPLSLYIPLTKELGHWEGKEAKDGAAFIQSGVYTTHSGDKITVKSRGFSPQNIGKAQGLSYQDAVDKELFETIPARWSDGIGDYPFDYQQYMGIGLCIINRKTWRHIGMWRIGPRTMQLDAMSNKRTISDDVQMRKARARTLVELDVNQFVNSDELSAKSIPDWLSMSNKQEREADEDGANIAAGLS